MRLCKSPSARLRREVQKRGCRPLTSLDASRLESDQSENHPGPKQTAANHDEILGSSCARRNALCKSDSCLLHIRLSHHKVPCVSDSPIAPTTPETLSSRTLPNCHVSGTPTASFDLSAFFLEAQRGIMPSHGSLYFFRRPVYDSHLLKSPRISTPRLVE